MGFGSLASVSLGSSLQQLLDCAPLSITVFCVHIVGSVFCNAQNMHIHKVLWPGHCRSLQLSQEQFARGDLCNDAKMCILAGGKDSCSSCIGATAGQCLPFGTAKARTDFQTHCFEPSGVVLHCIGVIVLWSHSACVGLTPDAGQLTVWNCCLTCTQRVC